MWIAVVDRQPGSATGRLRRSEDRPGALHEHHDDDHDPDENANDELAHGHRINQGAQRANRLAAPSRLQVHFSVSLPAPTEVFVSVDVEASGASPSAGSLLSIGACRIDRPDVGFYVELKPLADRSWDASAESVHGLTKERLESDGLEPAAAMEEFDRWVIEVSAGARPVFVGFNAPFDWMFVADYFWQYIGRNPFGISALDLKSYYMAWAGVGVWGETRRVNVDERLGLEPDHTHHALDDARGQAKVARILLGTASTRVADG